MREVIKALRAASLADDLDHLMDALWLAQHLTPADPDSIPDRLAPQPELKAPAPAQFASDGPVFDRPLRPLSGDFQEVVLPGRTPTQPSGGLYAAGGGSGSGRASAVRVAGVPALRDALGLARALRPLGRRLPSRRSSRLDEDLTVERFAETGTLVPCYVPRREPVFDVLFLVEQTPTLPLWSSVVDELAVLLSRRIGLRSFRRFELSASPEGLVARGRSVRAALPKRLLEGDKPLALLVSDGTSAAWRDGTMASTFAALGADASVALVQLLPERLWGNTALGSAEWLVSSPSMGAANRDLRSVQPAWMADEPPGVLVPTIGLRAQPVARWARMLSGRADARSPAGMIWVAAVDEGQPSDPTLQSRSATPEQLVSRLRSMAGPRVLQAAVYLSAAAPLTLPVVRLIQRIMLPHAPSEDLPLLLLSGLLNRSNVAGSAARDDVHFEFPDGVRELLQRSLLRGDVERVRAAVTAYISERVGMAISFSALVGDAEGDTPLPDWAQPFAEISRRLDWLFSPDPGGEGRRRVAEEGVAPGITIRARLAMEEFVMAVSYAPDGARLAVRSLSGVTFFSVARTASLSERPARERVTLARSADILFIKGWGVDELLQERVISSTRALLASHFSGEWEARFHSCVRPLPGERSSAAEIRSVARLIRHTSSIVCLFGDESFRSSSWLRTLRRELDDDQDTPVFMFEATHTGSEPDGVDDWSLRTHPQETVRSVRGNAPFVAARLVLAIRQNASRWLPEMPFDGATAGMAWLPSTSANPHPRFLALNAETRQIVVEGSATAHGVVPPELGVRAETLHVNAAGDAIAVTGNGRVCWTETPGRPDLPASFEGSGSPAFAWDPTGVHFALAWMGGPVSIQEARLLEDAYTPSQPLESGNPSLAWRPDGKVLAFGRDTQLMLVDVSARTEGLHDLPHVVESLAWSRDGSYLACGLAGGDVRLWRCSADPPLSLRQVAAWRAGPPNSDSWVSLAFSSTPLDDAFEELCVGYSDEVQLLRIDPAGLATKVPEPGPDISAEPEGMWLEAALSVLQSMALAFHVRQLATATQSLDRQALSALLGVETGEPRAMLNHLMFMTEWVFAGPVSDVLITGEDPVLGGSPEADAEMFKKRMDSWQAEIESPKRSSRGLARESAWLLTILDRIKAGDPGLLEAIGGSRLERYIDLHRGIWQQMEIDPGWRDAESPPSAEALELAADLLPRLRRVSTDHRVTRYCSSFYEYFGSQGLCEFARCSDYASYLERFVAFWKDLSTRLFERAEGLQTGTLIAMRYTVPKSHLELVQSTLALQDDAMQIGELSSHSPDGQPQHFWAVGPQAYCRLIEALGRAVVDAVRLRLQQPPRRPLVLWVDDQPQNNERERKDLDRRGIQVETAISTEQALEMLGGKGYELVISDMGRPPDRRAGYTLLDALRKAGNPIPFVIFSADQRPEHDQEAVARGALGSTEYVTALTGMLMRTLRASTRRAPPAAGVAAMPESGAVPDAA